MCYKEILEQTGPGRAFLEHPGAQILKDYLLDANHGGTFCGYNLRTSVPKKLWIRHCTFTAAGSAT